MRNYRRPRCSVPQPESTPTPGSSRFAGQPMAPCGSSLPRPPTKRAIPTTRDASANAAVAAVVNGTHVPPAGSFNRCFANVEALALVRATRNDCAGFESADIEASSSPTWQSWARSLSRVDLTSLRNWHDGAVRTRTRLHFRAGRNEALCACPYCGHARASARNFWEECPRFDCIRSALELEVSIPLAR